MTPTHIFGMVLGIAGGLIVWHFGGWPTVAGVFLMLWANNLSQTPPQKTSGDRNG